MTKSCFDKRNLTMLTDLYQLTMMYGYHKNNMTEQEAVFDLFFREIDDDRAYCVMAGTQSIIEYINNIHYDKDDIDYLRSLDLFDEDFLLLLANFKFTGEIYAMPEGEIVFPREPLVRVKAPILQAQLIETTLLTLVNHQTLIASKASRVRTACGNDLLMEFGLRRAQGADAGTLGARAAVIGGFNSTSNVLAGELFNIPVSGTHAHSWVMSFKDEITAFRAYAKIFPKACLLLVDTYNTLESGVPNAIKVFDELRQEGYEPMGIRLDSGDLAYISKKARVMLDEAGYPNAKICASGDLDETLIRELKAQGAKIDTWGIGTKLITSADLPALGGVYKMSAEFINGKEIPKIKLSENPVKMTYPGYKKVVRLYNKRNGMAIADLIMLNHESINESKPLRIFHPIHTYKSMVVENFTARELLVPVFKDGKQVYTSPELADITAYTKSSLATFWDEYKRLVRPHIYKVDISDELYELRQNLVNGLRKLS